MAEGGRRCRYGSDVKAITVAAQRVSRYHRQAGNLDLAPAEVAHLQELHSRAVQDLLDRKDLRYPPLVDGPTASRARDFTVDAVLARDASDEDLSMALGQLHNDPAAQEQILTTLEWMDRKDQIDADRAQRAAAAAQEAAWHDDSHDGDFVGLGEESPEWAEPTSRQSFAASMATTPGRRLTKQQQAREDYDRYVFNAYIEAEGECRGHMLTREGQARGIDPVTLFSSNRSTANRYASDELKSWWNRHGRLTFGEYRYRVLGWSSDRDAATRRRDSFDAA